MQPSAVAADVVEEEEFSARAEHPEHFGDGCAVVGYAAEAEGADDGVEGRVIERERLRVAFTKVDPDAGVGRAGAGDVEHGGAQIDAGEAGGLGVERQVAAGADGHFKDVTGGLAADPLSAAGELQAFEEGHVAVVARRVFVPELA